MAVEREKFYITTPIYYVNGKPHLGHSYTTVACDCLARFHRMLGHDVMFLTGADEHGQKIHAAAAEAGMSPGEFADQVVVTFLDLWRRLNISNDDFIRTTEERHYKTVQELFRRIRDRGHIYLGEYEGLYCTACERYYKEDDLADGLCPDHKTAPAIMKEKSYFFKLSSYQQPLIDHYEKNPGFVRPAIRYNEMMSRLRSGLEDLSISRSNLTWGIPAPVDEAHVIYVWFDALINYVTATGLLDDEARHKFWWPADIHMIGKDILWFHAVIWPAMLMAAGLELPKQVFAHGFWMVGESKMSKTVGNVTDPIEITDRFGVDALRYFLLREAPFGQDGKFSIDALVGRINADLANDLGNLLHRTLPMIERYNGGEIPAPGPEERLDAEIKALFSGLAERVEAMLRRLEFSQALDEIWTCIRRMNKYIDESAPWVLHKEGRKPRLDAVMYNLAESLRIIGVMVSPFMPETGARILEQLGIEDAASELDWDRARNWGGTRAGSRIRKLPPLFPRIEIEDPDRAEAAQDKKPRTTKPKAVEKMADEQAPMIEFDDFMKMELRVGTVLEAERVEKTDKLLKLSVDIGEDSPRTLVAGIAQSYSPEQLQGRKVVVVANLKPAKLRGVLSQGMVLAAVDGDKLSLVSPGDEMPNGARIS